MNLFRPNPCLVIAGPTASGKSALALACAQAFAGTVINADSLQLYRDLRVLTARPAAADEALVSHRLYGFLGPEESASVGRWRDWAEQEIKAVWQAGRLPILCGGTGLYLKGLIAGLAPVPPVPDEIREMARARMEALGPAAMHRELAQIDPKTAARLRPTDPQRITRAYEVFQATGRPLADWQAERHQPFPAAFGGVIVMPKRENLYANCDRRFAAMLEQGAVEEVRELLQNGLSAAAPIRKALGFSQLARHLAGKISREQAIQEAQTQTRQYAKRQCTWFRRQLTHTEIALMTLNSQYLEIENDKIFSFIRQFLLTVSG